MPDNLVTRAGFSQFASQFIQSARPLFASALGFTLRADPRNQLAQNDRHDEISAKQDCVICRTDFESEARRQKEKIPGERAQRPRK